MRIESSYRSSCLISKCMSHLFLNMAVWTLPIHGFIRGNNNTRPIMDGLTCVRRIREMQDVGLFIRHVPVIAITANARPEQIADALKAGMDAVVSKPFRIPELVSKIAYILRTDDLARKRVGIEYTLQTGRG